MTPIVMAAIECTCLAFLLVVLIAYLVLPRSGRLKRDAFFLSLVSMIAGLGSDMVSWACECWPSPQWLQYSANTLCLFASAPITSFFAYYVIGMIREKKLVSWNFAHVIALANLSGAVIVLAAACTGHLFDIIPLASDPGIMVYEAGVVLYDIPNYLSSLSLALLFAIVLRNSAALGKNRIVVFSIYFLMPLCAGILELIDEDLQLSYAVTGISMSIVYMMLQSSHLDELRMREKLLNEWSYVDPLTDLLNRRAFNRDTAQAKAEETVSVAFCDLNGLKYVNDEKGHEAGDRYLVGFAEMLTRHFPYESVYRISGDEFVIVARGIKEDAFQSAIRELRVEIESETTIAALGTAGGTGADLTALIKEAEVNMYSDKAEFYRKNPRYDRRRGR